MHFWEYFKKVKVEVTGPKKHKFLKFSVEFTLNLTSYWIFITFSKKCPIVDRGAGGGVPTDAFKMRTKPYNRSTWQEGRGAYRGFQDENVVILSFIKFCVARTFLVELHLDVVLKVFQVVGSKKLQYFNLLNFGEEEFRIFQNLRFGKVKTSYRSFRNLWFWKLTMHI